MSQGEPIFNLHKSIIAITVIILLVHVCRVIFFEGSDSFIAILAFIPACFSDPTSSPGCAYNNLITPWITYMFVHNDWGHALMNLAVMLAFGSAVAQRIGDIRFFLFSLLCGLGGILTHLIIYWGDPAPVFGASAAISGHVAGAVRYLFGSVRFQARPVSEIELDPSKELPEASYFQEKRLGTLSDFFRDFRAIIFVCVWVIGNILMGYMRVGVEADAAIAWEAHLGGFFAGLVLIDLFDRSYRKSQILHND